MEDKKNMQKKLCYVGGLLLILICYVFVFQNIRLRCVDMETKVEKTKLEEQQLLAMRDRQKENELQTKEMQKKMEELVKQFPVEVREEDGILHAAAMEEVWDIKVTNMDFTQTNLEQTGEQTGYTLYKKPIQYTFEAGYRDTKSMMRELTESGDMTNVESITLAYDSETGLLVGTMVTNYYSIQGQERIYKTPTNLGVHIGNNNMFATAK